MMMGDRYYVQTRLHDNSDDKIPSSVEAWIRGMIYNSFATLFFRRWQFTIYDDHWLVEIFLATLTYFVKQFFGISQLWYHQHEQM